MDKNVIKILVILFLIVLSSCKTIEKAGINMISDIMAGDGSSELFTGDNDPELVKDALPFILKMYEMLLGENPDDPELLLATGKTFIMYSNVFIQTPASMLPDEEYIEQHTMLLRSKKMYRRGTKYILKALDLKHPGFISNLDSGNIDLSLDELENEDIPFLYWVASGIMGEFSADPFDFSLGPNIYIPVALLYRALELNESYDNGAIHDLLILINSSLPEALMFKSSEGHESKMALFAKKYYNSLNIYNGFEKARYHFNRSIEISGGINASPYISLASTVSVNEQNYEEFEFLLNHALAIDPEEYPEMRLAGIIYNDKAQWLLDHKEDYFLLDFNEGEIDEVY